MNVKPTNDTIFCSTISVILQHENICTALEFVTYFCSLRMEIKHEKANILRVNEIELCLVVKIYDITSDELYFSLVCID